MFSNFNISSINGSGSGELLDELVKVLPDEPEREEEELPRFAVVGRPNAGKSSFFLKMSGKDVLVEDKLFSTLETTVGRLAASPRILLADTIGFIDNLPNATLDAFRATLSEALECDMLMLLVDATDEVEEFERKISATQREINTRFFGEDVSDTLNKGELFVFLLK